MATGDVTGREDEAWSERCRDGVLGLTIEPGPDGIPFRTLGKLLSFVDATVVANAKDVEPGKQFEFILQGIQLDDDGKIRFAGYLRYKRRKTRTPTPPRADGGAEGDMRDG